MNSSVVNKISTSTATYSNTRNIMMGMIASIQQNGKGEPAWITTGHWRLESDRPLLKKMVLMADSTSNNTIITAQPQVRNFTAIMYMVANSNGTSFDTYKISDFTQMSLTQEGANSVTVYGTFTITSFDGVSVKNVHGYIGITNNKMELWFDPAATQNHFGTATITGIVTMTVNEGE